MDEAGREKSEPKKECGKSETGDFRIRDFPDLRRLRKSYLKKGDKPIGFDSSDNPRPDDDEDDFGLTRSSPEEAWEFFRRELEKDCGDDPMTEFLDDK